MFVESIYDFGLDFICDLSIFGVNFIIWIFFYFKFDVIMLYGIGDEGFICLLVCIILGVLILLFYIFNWLFGFKFKFSLE